VSIELLTLADLGLDSPEETGTTFAENARLKAETAATQAKLIAIGDDSGLEVDALGGAPGVYSARYAGEHGNDAANNALLLKNMEGERDRRAAFICSLALYFPDGSAPIRANGAVEGEILFAPRGEGGFGYDPLFWYDPMGKTLAEMTAQLDQKNPGLPIIYAGGVMSNRRLQAVLSKRPNTYFADPQFSSDNAAGIALLCRRQMMKG
jgi:XTP/dITP diphosphohydrolase